MLRPIDQYFLQQDEPAKSVLLFLREYILQSDSNLTEEWKYGMPFYCYKGKMCCYLWLHKKLKLPYLGIVEGAKIHHPELLSEKRSRMKILLINPEADIDKEKISEILNDVLQLYLK
jgi:hypothetical protein